VVPEEQILSLLDIAAGVNVNPKTLTRKPCQRDQLAEPSTLKPKT
jgi:hypothetical protein